jgi:hypothetical protein
VLVGCCVFVGWVVLGFGWVVLGFGWSCSGIIYINVFFYFLSKKDMLKMSQEGICMNMSVKPKFDLRPMSYRTVFIVSLMSMLLVISLFSCGIVVGATSPVETELELTSAINDAVSGVPVVIALGKDITLTKALTIPATKNITLVSNGEAEFKLFGAADQSTLIVDDGGILVLDGVMVTHASGVKGSGVNVTSGGALILVSGRVFNNTDLEGGGVVNYGNFTMKGGAVSNNTAVMGGVVNYGNFTMTNGVISNSTATTLADDVDGGGVVNRGNFTMSGGEISNNKFCGVCTFGNFTLTGGKILKNIGNGVYNTGDFIMSGGDISNNMADYGGGVYISSSFGSGGNFTMTGGMIFNNSAIDNGGGVYNSGSTFKLSGGVIANNSATYGGGIFSMGNVTMSNGEFSNNTAAYGGGAYNQLGNFTMTNGILLNNTATQSGGGIYTFGGNFTMTGGKISSNTARNGGGVGVSSLGGLEYVYVYNGAEFSNNRASVSYERSSFHNELYNSRIGNTVTWTTPFKQGYNNYDICYIWGTETGGPSSSPPPSPTSSTPNTSPPTNTGSVPPNPPPGSTNIWRIVIVLALVAGFVVALLVFYLPRRGGAKPVEEDLSDFTIV